MAFRTVVGELRTPDNKPIKNEQVKFYLNPYGTETNEPVYPQSYVSVRTNEDGEFSKSLWVNEDSEKLSIYSVVLPTGERGNFILPNGAGEIDISDLLINHAPVAPSEQVPSGFPTLAQRDASNIGETQKPLWRTALDVEPAQTPASEAEAEAGTLVDIRSWSPERVAQAIAALQAIKADDARLTDSREWTADTMSQAEAEAGTATTRRAITAQRVAQAIAAQAAGGPEVLFATGALSFFGPFPQTETLDLTLSAGNWQIFAGFVYDTSWSATPQLLWEPNAGFQAKGFPGYAWKIDGFATTPTFEGGGTDGTDFPLPDGVIGMAMGSWFGNIGSTQTVQIRLTAQSDAVTEQCQILAIKLA